MPSGLEGHRVAGGLAVELALAVFVEQAEAVGQRAGHHDEVVGLPALEAALEGDAGGGLGGGQRAVGGVAGQRAGQCLGGFASHEGEGAFTGHVGGHGELHEGAEVLEHQVGAAACGLGQRGRQLVGKGAGHGGLLGGQVEGDGLGVHAFYGYQGVEGGVVGSRDGRAREGGPAAVDGFGIDHQLLIRFATVPQGYLVVLRPIYFVSGRQLGACLRHVGRKGHEHGLCGLVARIVLKEIFVAAGGPYQRRDGHG